jgi:NitT/TauT family transport system ATP-binding protein
LSPRRPLLSLTGVSKRYATGTLALDGIDLTIMPGDFIALLGPSGCGKSTLLRLIAGLTAPSGGIMEWPMAMHDAAGEVERDIGFVFQEPTLMPWASVAQNVWLPFRLQGTAFRTVEPRIIEALALVGLDTFAGAYPRELSGGMKMRVSIARALVTNPRLILMDEPFAALDEITRQKLNNDLLALKAKIGCTVIFVTHSVFESVFLSDRVVIMAARPGRVIRELTVDAPYPRDMVFRTSPAYAAACREASDALVEAMGEAA